MVQGCVKLARSVSRVLYEVLVFTQLDVDVERSSAKAGEADTEPPIIKSLRDLAQPLVLREDPGHVAGGAKIEPAEQRRIEALAERMWLELGNADCGMVDLHAEQRDVPVHSDVSLNGRGGDRVVIDVVCPEDQLPQSLLGGEVGIVVHAVHVVAEELGPPDVLHIAGDGHPLPPETTVPLGNLFRLAFAAALHLADELGRRYRHCCSVHVAHSR